MKRLTIVCRGAYRGMSGSIVPRSYYYIDIYLDEQGMLDEANSRGFRLWGQSILR